MQMLIYCVQYLERDMITEATEAILGPINFFSEIRYNEFLNLL